MVGAAGAPLFVDQKLHVHAVDHITDRQRVFYAPNLEMPVEPALSERFSSVCGTEDSAWHCLCCCDMMFVDGIVVSFRLDCARDLWDCAKLERLGGGVTKHRQISWARNRHISDL